MDTDNSNKELMDIDTAIAYAQLAVYTLQHSLTIIDKKSLSNEIKMLQKKFGTREVKRLAKIIIK